jgi:hypothetical protein
VSKVSDEFFNALHHDGSICRDCSCGRTHFASYSNEGAFEPGELEGLRRKAEADPTHYIEHDCSTVTVAHLNNKEFVYECPCDGLLPYEQFIWIHRDEILEFLTARHKIQLRTLQAFNNKLQAQATALAEVEKIHLPE